RLFHLEPEVVAVARALPHTCEHRYATVLARDAIDHLLDDDGLADAGAAEHPDLSTLHVRLDEVDDLDAGLEHLDLRLELVERRRVAVDRPPLRYVDVRRVERLPDPVPHVSERRVPDPPLDWLARGLDAPRATAPR